MIDASAGGSFLFTFNISANYPHEAPKVKCKTKVRRSNIGGTHICECEVLPVGCLDLIPPLPCAYTKSREGPLSACVSVCVCVCVCVIHADMDPPVLSMYQCPGHGPL